VKGVDKSDILRNFPANGQKMRIIKFRILNYKSVKDSGDCYFSPTVTILAGKNEAGKSSILEALRDFSEGILISEKVCPINNENDTPEIKITFELLQKDITSICRDLEIDVLPVESLEICITKKYPSSYEIDTKVFESFFPLLCCSYFQRDAMDAFKAIFRTPIIGLMDAQGIPLPPIPNDINFGDHISEYIDFRNMVVKEDSLSELSADDLESIRDNIDALISACQKAAACNKPQDFLDELMSYIPNFILFSSFNDVFPNNIPFAEFDTNEWIADLKHISNLDIDVIKGTNDRKRAGHKMSLNLRINNDFAKYWAQDKSDLSIDWDSSSLSFWIREGDVFYEPEIRSQGRRWHLAFYIRVSARARENVRNVILIDEPGLYLHANAQRDILKTLDDAGSAAQLVFSTHSPYLIEADKLDRIRLVLKTEDRGTYIENKVHAVADAETLTPILTSIGLEMNRGIMSVDKNNNVIVEGPSDYFYLHAIKNIFNWTQINFISGGSSGNMPKIGTILQGWGCKVIYLYDNDQAYADAIKSVRKDWKTIPPESLAKLPYKGAIEDLFSRDDYAKFIAECHVSVISGRNSEHVRNRDKVLRARLFLEKTQREPQEIMLTQETKDNCGELYEIIKQKLAL
jgi:predicted ATP-dependent endonuclease of OLD family